MAGSIQKRGAASWRLRVHAGAGRYISETVRGTRKDAERRLSRLVVEVADGKRVAATAQTLGQLLDQWYANKEPDLASKTRELYRGILDRHLIPTLGAPSLSRVHTSDLERLYGDLRRRGLS